MAITDRANVAASNPDVRGPNRSKSFIVPSLADLSVSVRDRPSVTTDYFTANDTEYTLGSDPTAKFRVYVPVATFFVLRLKM